MVLPLATLYLVPESVKSKMLARSYPERLPNGCRRTMRQLYRLERPSLQIWRSSTTFLAESGDGQKAAAGQTVEFRNEFLILAWRSSQIPPRV